MRSIWFAILATTFFIHYSESKVMTIADTTTKSTKEVLTAGKLVCEALGHAGGFKSFLSVAGAFGGILAVGLEIGKMFKNDPAEWEKVVIEMNKKFDLLSHHIEDSANKVMAHIDKSEFRQDILAPTAELKKKFMDYVTLMNQENNDALKRQCKKTDPMNIFIRIKTMLQNDFAKAYLESNQYTNEAFENLQTIIKVPMHQLVPIYFTCKAMLYDNENNEEHRHKQLNSEIEIILDLLHQINANRETKIWPLMLHKIKKWLEDKRLTTEHMNLAVAIQTELNEQYSGFGYEYIAGVHSANDSRYLFFECKPDCEIGKKNETVIWVYRTKSCHNDKKYQMTNKCIAFQKQLYNTFYNDNIFFEDDSLHDYTAETVVEVFKKNCKIITHSGAVIFSEKLDGGLSEPNPTDNSVAFNIQTQYRHKRQNLNKFGDLTIISGCDNENHEVFDFFEEYCSPHSVFPNCLLTEEAFHHHHLLDQEPEKSLKQNKAMKKAIRAGRGFLKGCKLGKKSIIEPISRGCIELFGGKKAVEIE